MGWASGSYLAEQLYTEIRKHLPNNPRRQKIARAIVEAFENHDADDWDLGHPLHRDAGLYKICGCDVNTECECEL